MFVLNSNHRIAPLIIVLPTIESRVGIQKTNYGCWCILDFFNLRPDDGVRLYVYYGACSR